MQSNWKSFGLGFVVASALWGLMAANKDAPQQQHPVGRYTALSVGDFALTLDSATGRAWWHKINNSGKEGDIGFGLGQFHGEKNESAK